MPMCGTRDPIYFLGAFMRLEGEVRIPSGCAISAAISRKGRLFTGEAMIKAMETMHERSNGLGGGFAAYGIYPEYKDYYAFHVFFTDREARKETEAFLKDRFEVVDSSVIATRTIPEITDVPLIWRYFLSPLRSIVEREMIGEDEYTVRAVTRINSTINGAYVFSSGKNMGTFKAVGYPEDVGKFYKIDEIEGYSWTAHGRYPTNTPGWWGGAHPFSLLDFSVVHNGEISSYDANRRFVEMFGYRCSLQTDTEVITYILDYLIRRQGLTPEESANVIAAPFWSTIERKSEEERKRLTYLRTLYSSLLITGPFSIVLGFTGGIMALNDRLKLRSMVVGEHNDMVYVASEEAAVLAADRNAGSFYFPMGGEPVVVKVEGEV